MDADFLCVVVIVYSVLFMEWETEDTVFHVVSALSWELSLLISWLTLSRSIDSGEILCWCSGYVLQCTASWSEKGSE
jgi:hypothetical protein